MNGIPYAPSIQTADAGGSLFFIKDADEFVKEASSGKTAEDIKGQGVFNQPFGRPGDVEGKTLFKTYGAQDARGVFHKA